MIYETRGDQIGTFTSASLNGTNAPNAELSVFGAVALDTSGEIHTIAFPQNLGDTFTKGQF